jgi:adenylate kinase
MIIILIGPQGSGKGTQGQLLKRNHHIHYISTGSLLRKMAKHTKNGDKLKATDGKLLPDSVINGLVEEEMQKHHTANFIFDGYPRTTEQAEFLSDYINDHFKEKKSMVIYFELDDNEAIRRISKRLTCVSCGFVTYPSRISLYQIFKICPNCHHKLAIRADDNEVAVKERLRIFRKDTFPLINYYSDKHILFTVDARKNIGAINEEVERILNENR